MTIKRKCKGKCQDTYHNVKDVQSIKELGLCNWCWKYLSNTEKKDWIRNNEK